MGKSPAVVVLSVATFVACSQPAAKSQPQPAEALPAVIAKAAEPEPVDRVGRAKHALALYDARRYDEAVPALTAVATEYAEVAPFLRLRIVEAELARQNLQQAASVAAQLVALSDTTAATVARLRLPVIYAQLGDAAATDAAWQRAMEVALDELTEQDFVSMATALAKAGRNDLASKTRMRLLSDYTSGRYTEQTY